MEKVVINQTRIIHCDENDYNTISQSIGKQTFDSLINSEITNLKWIDAVNQMNQEIKVEGISGRRANYLISDSDKKPKKSNHYCDCQGVYLTGNLRTCGTEISLLTHQQPLQLHNFPDIKKEFFDMLDEKVSHHVEKSRYVDAFLFGGYYHPEHKGVTKNLTIHTKDLMNFFKKKGIKTHIASIPKSGGRDNIFVDTPNRTSYIYKEAHYSKEINITYKNMNYSDFKKLLGMY